MTFEEAFASYMTVSGTERGDAYQDRLKFKFFQSQFGRNCPIEDISPRYISRSLSALRGKLITRKGVRVPLAPATINKHTQFLQRIFRHVEDLNEPVQRIRWRAFKLMEAEQKISPLSEDEERFVLENIHENVRPIFQFSVLTGVRLLNAVQLRWSMIDWEAKEITFRGKSRRPGGKTYVIPLTETVIELLRSLEGHHEEFVFTYVSAARGPHAKMRGKRLPLTKHVTRYYWERLKLGKRWHDVRHTFGTRLYEVSKDLFLVQRAMNHSDINTTKRYVHPGMDDIREAMEKLPSSRSFRNMNKRSATRHIPFTVHKTGQVVKFERNQAGAVERTRTSTDHSAATSTRRGNYKQWDEDHSDD